MKILRKDKDGKEVEIDAKTPTSCGRTTPSRSASA